MDDGARLNVLPGREIFSSIHKLRSHVGTSIPRTAEIAVAITRSAHVAAARGLILWRHARYCSGCPIRSSRAAKEPVLCRRSGPYPRTGTWGKHRGLQRPL